jgi:large subunit ribosomal protein L35
VAQHAAPLLAPKVAFLEALERGQRFQIRRGFPAMPRNASKPKLKLKTHRGARKRFKFTANGKIKRGHSGKRHLMGTKAPGRMRKLKKLTLVNKADVASVKQMLPYG